MTPYTPILDQIDTTPKSLPLEVPSQASTTRKTLDTEDHQAHEHMDDQHKAIARVTVTIVIVLLLSLTLVAYLSGGLEAVAAMLTTFLIIALPLALLGGLVLFVLNRL